MPAVAHSPAQLEPAQLKPGEASRRRTVTLLLLFSAVLYLGASFYPSLLDDADSSHAVVAREMLTRSDYVTLYMNGLRYLMKAPLHYWMVAAAYRIFGENAFATRLPVALSMIALTLALYEFGRRFFGARAGLYSALACATSVGMFIFTRIMIPEALYALQFTLIFYLFLRAWTGTMSPRPGYRAAAALIGLAVLTRGLIGLVFPVGTILLFVLASGSWRRWRELPLKSCALIFLAIALPWHILAELRSPGFFWSYFVNEHFWRALGIRWPPDYDAVPLWLWWAEHLAWFSPWIAFLPCAWKQFVPLRRWRSSITVEEQARLLLFLWAALIFVFFSVIGGSRMEYYAFGAWPAVALLLGLGLARSEEAHEETKLYRLQSLLAVLGLLIAVVLTALVVKSYDLHQASGLAALLKTHENDFYRVSMGHLFDLTPQAFAALRLPALLAAAALGPGLSSAWLLRSRARGTAAALAMAASMAVFFAAANLAYGDFQPLLSSRDLADAINAYLRPQDQVAVYGDFDELSSIAFYTGRCVWICDGDNTQLRYGAQYPDAPKVLLNDAEFAAVWRRRERVFLAITARRRPETLPRLQPQGAWVLAESDGKIVLTNQPVAPSQAKLSESAP